MNKWIKGKGRILLRQGSAVVTCYRHPSLPGLFIAPDIIRLSSAKHLRKHHWTVTHIDDRMHQDSNTVEGCQKIVPYALAGNRLDARARGPLLGPSSETGENPSERLFGRRYDI